MSVRFVTWVTEIACTTGVKYICDVCYDTDCHRMRGVFIHCGDCSRYCKSAYRFQKHKQQAPRSRSGVLAAPCDITKYCKDCNRRYRVCVEQPKAHRCAEAACHHCRQRLTPTTITSVTYSLSNSKRSTTNTYLRPRDPI